VTLIYAFANSWSTNISAQVLNEIANSFPSLSREGLGVGFDSKGISYQKIYGHPKTFFQTHIYGKIYDSIIGLGDFYGDFPKIRLETIAKNQYGYKPISTNSPFQTTLNTPPLSYNPNIVICKNMGNYNCNWIAYQTQLYLNSKDLDTIHLFFHLPKKLPPALLATHITQFLLGYPILKLI